MPRNPPLDCPLCPRLVQYRRDNREAEPDWHNAPVASFGPDDAALLIVGLAPGVSGANRTGRPFTGDFAGDLLYETLGAFGFAEGRYDKRPDDGLLLRDCRITNAVRCVPPQNKPTGEEARTCRPFLSTELNENKNLQAVLALGRIAHDNVLAALELRKRDFAFGHGAVADGAVVANPGVGMKAHGIGAELAELRQGAGHLRSGPGAPPATARDGDPAQRGARRRLWLPRAIRLGIGVEGDAGESDEPHQRRCHQRAPARTPP